MIVHNLSTGRYFCANQEVTKKEYDDVVDRVTEIRRWSNRVVSGSAENTDVPEALRGAVSANVDAMNALQREEPAGDTVSAEEFLTMMEAEL